MHTTLRYGSTLSLAAFAALILSACASPSTPTQPDVSVAATASPSAALRTVQVGQSWDVPGWRIAVTGMTCGLPADPSFQEDPAGEACAVHLAYTNTGSGPAWFAGQAGAPSAVDDARGYDARGRVYDFTLLAHGEMNPGASSTTDLRFVVTKGIRLVRVTMVGVSVDF